MKFQHFARTIAPQSLSGVSVCLIAIASVRWAGPDVSTWTCASQLASYCTDWQAFNLHVALPGVPAYHHRRDERERSSEKESYPVRKLETDIIVFRKLECSRNSFKREIERDPVCL
ncbi:hypothetical protein AMTR_s00061p00050550 [Amborella trichopoda]|uniref:Uncharacterized protein n=1 Tax=Amborella trichopoda TaxID=13333 RepID=U5DF46_AMBTC|nr:hypothetical protein AMTR_s00061p00050550 [Amborella trichopoda]